MRNDEIRIGDAEITVKTVYESHRNARIKEANVEMHKDGRRITARLVIAIDDPETEQPDKDTADAGAEETS